MNNDSYKQKMQYVLSGIFLGILIIFIITIINCSYTKRYINYGNNDYIFATLYVLSDEIENKTYSGTISKDDFNDWCLSRTGTIKIYDTTEDKSISVMIDNVYDITNFGSTPDWLPISFW